MRVSSDSTVQSARDATAAAPLMIGLRSRKCLEWFERNIHAPFEPCFSCQNRNRFALFSPSTAHGAPLKDQSQTKNKVIDSAGGGLARRHDGMPRPRDRMRASGITRAVAELNRMFAARISRARENDSPATVHRCRKAFSVSARRI